MDHGSFLNRGSLSKTTPGTEGTLGGETGQNIGPASIIGTQQSDDLSSFRALPALPLIRIAD
jgi:hypothetical protein